MCRAVASLFTITPVSHAAQTAPSTKHVVTVLVTTQLFSLAAWEMSFPESEVTAVATMGSTLKKQHAATVN